MELEILVDGYNVIKNNAMFQFLDVRHRADARSLLLKQLHNRFMRTPHRVTVVFDGDGAREMVTHEEHIRVIYSPHGVTADSVIARLATELASAGRNVALFSNDGEVRQAVSKQGGSVHTTQQLTTQLTAAPRDVTIRSQHRQTMRRVYGIDPMHKAVDEEEERPHPRGKKKKKSPHPHR